jgi:hypothetical protein
VSVDILDADEEQLVAETKRNVLPERRVGMSAQPSLDPSFDLLAQVIAGRLPTMGESSRHLLHLNIVHFRFLSPQF